MERLLTQANKWFPYRFLKHRRCTESEISVVLTFSVPPLLETLRMKIMLTRLDFLFCLIVIVITGVVTFCTKNATV